MSETATLEVLLAPAWQRLIASIRVIEETHIDEAIKSHGFSRRKARKIIESHRPTMVRALEERFSLMADLIVSNDRTKQ